MCGGLKKRYILAALVCFGAVMFGGGFCAGGKHNGGKPQ